MKNFLTTLKNKVEHKTISEQVCEELSAAYVSYRENCLCDEVSSEWIDQQFFTYLELIERDFENPYQFPHFQPKITSPFDHEKFGIDFVRPLFCPKHSGVLYEENINTISSQLKAGDNVILLVNHQSELDPQCIRLLVEHQHPDLINNMICVAGHRVVSDPLSKPFSLGCNLLFIHSRRYINTDPGKKEEKIIHNQRAIKTLRNLLKEGSKLIFLAPAGGRDRMDPLTKTVVVSDFDPLSIEMFRLLGNDCPHPTHFYPVALLTCNLLPPPNEIRIAIGEPRKLKKDGIWMACGREEKMLIDQLDTPFKSLPNEEKSLLREQQAKQLQKTVVTLYQKICESKKVAENS